MTIASSVEGEELTVRDVSDFIFLNPARAVCGQFCGGRRLTTDGLTTRILGPSNVFTVLNGCTGISVLD